MKKGIVIAITVILILPWVGVPTAHGQEFSILLEAVEKIEASLSQKVQAEATIRNKQITELQNTIAKLDVSGYSTGGVSEEQLVDIITELSALRVEVQTLKRSLTNNSKQLASIDQNSWVSPDPSDDVVDQLASKLAVINENVENLVANQNKVADMLVSKPSGPKTTVNGRMYSHGMADFSDGSDNNSEFALSRAYVTLKSKVSSFASIRITSDFKSIDDKYNIILKYAYLDWKPSFSKGVAKLRFGLQPTQYIDNMNKLWGRRYLEKTVGDSRKFLTSSDLGVSTIVGFGHKSKYGFASIALLNGTSYSHVQELNNHKDFNLVSLVKPFRNVPAFHKSSLIMQLYSGAENKSFDDIVNVDTAATPWDTTLTGVSGSDWKRQIASVGGLLAWNSTLDVGFDLNFTTVGKGVGIDAVKKHGLSFFGSFYLRNLIDASQFMSSVNFFARFDSYDPNTKITADGEAVSIFGIESAPVKGLKVALNYRSTSFEDDSRERQSKLYINTLFKF